MTEFKVEVADNGWILRFRQNVKGPSDPFAENTTSGILVERDLAGIMRAVESLIKGDSDEA